MSVRNKVQRVGSQKLTPLELLLCAKHLFHSSEQALFYLDILRLFLTAISTFLYLTSRFITPFGDLTRDEQSSLVGQSMGSGARGDWALVLVLLFSLCVTVSLSGSQFPICKVELSIAATSDNWSADTGRSPLVSFHPCQWLSVSWPVRARAEAPRDTLNQ